jgi:hypothetical protein
MAKTASLNATNRPVSRCPDGESAAKAVRKATLEPGNEI